MNEGMLDSLLIAHAQLAYLLCISASFAGHTLSYVVWTSSLTSPNSQILASAVVNIAGMCLPRLGREVTTAQQSVYEDLSSDVPNPLNTERCTRRGCSCDWQIFCLNVRVLRWLQRLACLSKSGSGWPKSILRLSWWGLPLATKTGATFSCLRQTSCSYHDLIFEIPELSVSKTVCWATVSPRARTS